MPKRRRRSQRARPRLGARPRRNRPPHRWAQSTLLRHRGQLSGFLLWPSESWRLRSSTTTSRIATVRVPRLSRWRTRTTRSLLHRSPQPLYPAIRRLGSVFGQQPQAALSLVADELIDEALLLRFAADQGQSATDDEVKAEIAKLLTLTGADDPTFDTRLQEELSRTGFTEQQYRDMARRRSSSARLRRSSPPRYRPSPNPSTTARSSSIQPTRPRATPWSGRSKAAPTSRNLPPRSPRTPQPRRPGARSAGRRAVRSRRSSKTRSSRSNPASSPSIPPARTSTFTRCWRSKLDRPVEDAQKSTISQNKFRSWLDEKRASVKIVNDMDLADGDIEKIDYALKRVQQTT